MPKRVSYTKILILFLIMVFSVILMAATAASQEVIQAVNSSMDPQEVLYSGIDYYLYSSFYSGAQSSIYKEKGVNGLAFSNRTLVHRYGVSDYYKLSYNPRIVKVNSTYHMYHTDYYTWASGQWAAFVARLSGTNGYTWTNDVSVLQPNNKGSCDGDWQAGQINIEDIIYDNGVYHMWYTGTYRWSCFGSGYFPSLGYANSVNGVNFINRQRVVDENGNFIDQNHAEWMPSSGLKGRVFEYNNFYYMIYPKGGNLKYRISSDGVNWRHKGLFLSNSTVSSLTGRSGNLYPSSIFEDKDGITYLYFVFGNKYYRVNLFDSDNDNISFSTDNCPFAYNPWQTDGDLDESGNECDNCFNIYNPEQIDSDSDGIGDDCDNCKYAINPNQNDLDGDSAGDACDLCPGTAPGTPAAPNGCPDQDGDEFDDLADNCPSVYNPGQEDIDGDKILNMILYWRFDEGSGTTTADSADANSGVLVNGPVWTAGKIGSALSFDGVNDYVISNKNINITGTKPRSVEFWAKTNSFPSGTAQPVLWWGSQYYYRLNLISFGNRWATSQPVVNFYGYYRDVPGVTALSSNWTHVAVIYDSTRIKIHVNGVLDVSSSQALNTYSSKLTVGYYSGWPKYFLGEIDEVAIYNKVLSLEDIQRHYKAGLKGYSHVSDGIGDLCDNCPFAPNRNQEDSDSDGIGDLCEDVISDVEAPETISRLTETASSEYNLIEDISSKKGRLNLTATGALNGYLTLNNFEIVTIETGSFAGKGFSKGNWQATLEGLHYSGTWQGMFYPDQSGSKIYLKGTTSGDIDGIIEATLTESITGSNLYDQYSGNWRLAKINSAVASGTIALEGEVFYQTVSEYPSTEFYALQSSIDGNSVGHYVGPLGTVLTHLRVASQESPYYGEGFTIMSYTSDYGTGNGWLYNKLVVTNISALQGVFEEPLLGLVSGSLDETTSRKLAVSIERIDFGDTPMADLKVTTWGPTGVSPGQTINYIIEYRNDGLKTAKDVVILDKFPEFAEYRLSTGNGIYRWENNEVLWKLGDVPAGKVGQVGVELRINWGLPAGTQLKNIATIESSTEELDRHIYPDLSPFFNVDEYVNYIEEPVPQSVTGYLPWNYYVDGMVNTFSGNLYFSEQDIEIKTPGLYTSQEVLGKSTIPNEPSKILRLIRSYNSLDNETNGPFGYGWTHNYNVFLTLESGGMLMHDSDGAKYFFEEEAGNYISPSGVHLKLKKLGDGSFEVWRKDGSILSFDSDGKLTLVADKNGNQLTLIYTLGKLTRIEGYDGLALDIRYDIYGRIIKVTDPIGRMIAYSYDSNGNLKEVVDPMGNSLLYFYEPGHKLAHAVNTAGISLDFRYISNKVTNIGKSLYNSGGIFTNYDPLKAIVYGDDAVYIFGVRGDKTTVKLNSNGNPTEITDALGGVTQKEWNSDMSLAEFKDQNGNIYVYEYDALGNPTKVLDPLNNTYVNEWENLDSISLLKQVTNKKSFNTKINYDSSGNIVEVIDALNQVFSYSYDSNGNPVEMTNARGYSTSVSYDFSNNRITWTDANGNTTTYEYDAVGRLIRKTDALGRTTVYGYDNNDRLVEITDSAGASTMFFYNNAGSLMKIIDALGRETNVGHNMLSKKDKIIDAMGNINSEVYDQGGNKIESKDPAGNAVAYEYDLLNRMTKLIDADGNEMTFEYDYVGNLIKETDKKGYATSYEYDSLNRNVKVIDALGNEELFVYDVENNLVQHTDKEGYTAYYEYDPLNKIVVITDPLGGEIKYQYDESNNVVKYTDAKDHVVQYEYDSLDRNTRVIDPLGNFESYSYDAVGNVVRSVDKKGYETLFEYDGRNRLVMVTDALGNQIKYDYDAVGNKIRETDENSNSIEFRYDSLNRVVKEINALGHETNYAYDSRGNLAKIIDANGNEIRYSYDSLNRLVTDSNAVGSTAYIYDAEGNIISVTDGSGNTVMDYEYDGLNRLVKTTTPLGKESTTEYDANDNIIRSIDADGKETVFVYDKLNRLTEKSYGGFATVKYSYDENGNLIHAEDDIVRDYSYDGFDRLVSVTTDYGSFSKSVDYTYDENGNRKTVTVDGDTTTYGYDGMEKIISIENSGELTTFNYDDSGKRTRLVQPNGAETVYSYDNADSLTSITNKKSNSDIISSYSYTHDNIGNRLSMTDADGGITTYTYDALNRLTAMNSPSENVVYSYDDVGNRLTETRNSSIAYTYDSDNQLLEAGAATYSYDDSGNLIGKNDGSDTTTYEYNYEHKLVKVVLPDSSEVSYKYASDGDRISRTDADGTSYYLFDEEDMVMEMDEAGLEKARYVYGIKIDEPLTMERGAAKVYYHSDALGSVTELTDSSESVVQTYKYDAFGKITAQTGSIENAFTYTSREYDDATGLYYYRERHYDAEVGRFTSRDPLLDVGEKNSYVYVDNNPVNLVDPLGMTGVPPNLSYRGQIDWIRTYISNFMLLTPKERKALPINEQSYTKKRTGIKKTTWTNQALKGHYTNAANAIVRLEKAAMEEMNPKVAEKLFRISGKLRQKLEKKYATVVAKKMVQLGYKEVAGKWIKTGARKIPIAGIVAGLIFLPGAVEAKGFWGGLADAILDATPYVGGGKLVVELGGWELIPTKEEYKIKLALENMSPEELEELLKILESEGDDSASSVKKQIDCAKQSNELQSCTLVSYRTWQNNAWQELVTCKCTPKPEIEQYTNNMGHQYSAIVVARDPNIKYGPEGAVEAGQTLNYKVEYENEGAGIAFGVYFTDKLDEDLDGSTLVIGPVKSTADDSVIASPGTYNPATRTITWLVGEVGSNQGGYSEFSVDVRADAEDMAEIMNFATVYFPSVPEETRTNAIISIVGLDIDGDGIYNAEDNCVDIANAWQEDLDSDGIGDVCDYDVDGDSYEAYADCDDSDSSVYPGAKEIRNGIDDNCNGEIDDILDNDDDGVLNEVDNCPDIYNPAQINSDDDSLGDACDDDDDNDSILDETDNCPLVANAGQEDFDGDLLGDACDDDDDNDDVLDANDACHFTFGKESYQGCPVGDDNLVELNILDATKVVCVMGSCKIPIEGTEIKVFDRNNTEFQAKFTKNPDGALYPDVFEQNAGKVGGCITNNYGKCIAGEESIGTYLVIVRYVDLQAGKIVYTGKPKGLEDFQDTDGDGEMDLAFKDFQVIKTISKQGAVNFKSGSRTVVKDLI